MVTSETIHPSVNKCFAQFQLSEFEGSSPPVYNITANKCHQCREIYKRWGEKELAAGVSVKELGGTSFKKSLSFSSTVDSVSGSFLMLL